MIRKLTDADHNAVMELLNIESSINLFIIGDIESFGYDTDFQELWGQFQQDGSLIAVMMRYHNSFIPYARGKFNVKGFIKIIRKYTMKPNLAGKEEVVRQFERKLGLILINKKKTYFAECITPNIEINENVSVKIATPEDVDRIIRLRESIEEFNMSSSDARKILLQAMKKGTSRTYYIERYGKMISCASTSAENSKSAMVVGVCTHPSYRQKGYATACLQKLLIDLYEENKSICLFYDNPKAGRIYKRLGFKDIGYWTMYN